MKQPPDISAFRLTPLDVALFRDARPFSADDATGARLQSPMPPQLGLLGAMRYLLLTSLRLSFQDFNAGKGDDLLDKRRVAVGESPTRPGTLQLGPVTLALQDSNQPAAHAHYPLPADLTFLKKLKKETQVSFCLPKSSPASTATSLPEDLTPLAPVRFTSSGTPRLVWVSENDGFSVSSELSNAFLAYDQLTAYLTASKTPLTSPGSALVIEKRIGIERNAETFTAMEGKLYTAEFVRPKPNAFYALPVLESAAELPAGRNVIPIGGESRPFEVSKDTSLRLLPDDAWPAVRSGLLDSASWQDGETLLFRIVLLSAAPPAHSTGPHGWRPFLPPGLDLEIFAAAVSRPKWLSGWITQNGKGGSPRDARPYIPAGSVFFIRARKPPSVDREAFVDTILQSFWYRPALVDPSQNQFDYLAGHGVTLVGLVPTVQE